MEQTQLLHRPSQSVHTPVKRYHHHSAAQLIAHRANDFRHDAWIVLVLATKLCGSVSALRAMCNESTVSALCPVSALRTMCNESTVSALCPVSALRAMCNESTVSAL